MMGPAGWVVAGAFTLGALVSGGLGGVAYWTQGQLLKAERLDHATLKSAVEIEQRDAKSKAEAAQLVIDALGTDLAHSWKMRQTEYVHVETEIVRYTSATAVALGPRPIRVLNDMSGARVPLGANPGRVAGGGTAAAAPAGGSASERALAQYIALIKTEYYHLQDRHSRLARAVCAVPSVICE